VGGREHEVSDGTIASAVAAAAASHSVRNLRENLREDRDTHGQSTQGHSETGHHHPAEADKNMAATIIAGMQQHKSKGNLFIEKTL
jgi:hypothetical protein